MEEKQLKGNLVEITRSLLAKFDALNLKGNTKTNDCPHEILTIQAKLGRLKKDSDVDNVTRTMCGLICSTSDPCPTSW